MKQSSLTKILKNKLETDVDSSEFTLVYTNYVSYITGGINAFTFQKRIKPVLPKSISAKVLRLNLIESKYTFFTLKIFVLNLPNVRLNTSNDVYTLGKSLDIHKRDIRRIWDIWKGSRILRARVRTLVKSIPKEINLNLKYLDSYFSTEVYPEVMKKVKSVTYKKLRFIARSSNLDLADLQNELMIKAIQTFYKEFPSVKSKAHLINYIKRAVIHRSTNIIMEATSKKRGRFICSGFDKNNERVFSLLSVSENQLRPTGEDQHASLDSLSTNYVDTTRDLENEICVTTILNKYRMKTKKYRLLLILMGKYDEQFTLWLRKHKKCSSSEDNSDVQDALSTDDFRKLVSQFLNVDDDRVNVFLFNLGQRIVTPYEHTTLKNSSVKKVRHS